VVKSQACERQRRLYNPMSHSVVGRSVIVSTEKSEDYAGFESERWLWVVSSAALASFALISWLLW
jgi:hypothetical protein